jgi:hypothetical protein
VFTQIEHKRNCRVRERERGGGRHLRLVLGLAEVFAELVELLDLGRVGWIYGHHHFTKFSDI